MSLNIEKKSNDISIKTLKYLEGKNSIKINDLVIKKSRNSMLVDASFRIEDLQENFNIKIETPDEDEINTVGGLVYAKINRIPKNNEIFYIGKNIKIKIISSSDRKIKTLEVEKLNN